MAETVGKNTSDPAPFTNPSAPDENRLFATVLIFLPQQSDTGFHRYGIHCYGGLERFVLQERR